MTNTEIATMASAHLQSARCRFLLMPERCCARSIWIMVALTDGLSGPLSQFCDTRARYFGLHGLTTKPAFAMVLHKARLMTPRAWTRWQREE